MGLLVFPFVLIPLVEVVLFIAIGGRIGLLNVVLTIIATGVVGAMVASRQGGAVWLQGRRALAEGRFPGREIAHGAMILFGGALLLTPGFLTDAVGLLLMVPAVRDMISRWGRRSFDRRVGIVDL
jgi:UPF0716 protein FxsA